MALSIKNPRTEALARELSRESGESVTEAITQPLEDRLARLRELRKANGRRAQITMILAMIDAIPEVDRRPADEILGYDQDGLP